MTFVNERHAIETTFASAWVTTPIVYDNTPFVASTMCDCVALSLLGGEGQRISLGPTPLQRYSGIIQIDIYTPAAAGQQLARERADVLYSIFSQRELLLSAGGVIRCAVPYISRPPQVAGQAYRLVMSIPYRRDKL